MLTGGRTFGAMTMAGAALALSGCAAGGATAPAETAALPPQHERTAERHREKKFLVAYGGEPFLVNVRYIGMIGQSVIAVRQGEGEAVAEGWERLAVKPRGPAPDDAPFADAAYRDVAIEIAEAVSRKGAVCGGERPMMVSQKDSGEAKTMFRDERQAWVVFAACPRLAEG